MLSSLLYWYSVMIQYESSLEEVKEFILVFRYITKQVTINYFYSFCNMLHNGASIISPDPSTLCDHLKNTMSWPDIALSEYGLLIVYPYVVKCSICVYSCLFPSENKPQVGLLSYREKTSPTSLQIWLRYWNLLSIEVDKFNYDQQESYQHITDETYLTILFPCVL